MDDLFTKAAIIVAALFATLSSFPSTAQRQPEPAAKRQQTVSAGPSPNHPSRKGELTGDFDFKSAKTAPDGLVVRTKENAGRSKIQTPKD